MPEVIFQGNGTDEVFHVLVDPRQNYVQRWASLQVGYSMFAQSNIKSKTSLTTCTANEGPVRIQHECLVP